MIDNAILKNRKVKDEYLQKLELIRKGKFISIEKIEDFNKRYI